MTLLVGQREWHGRLKQCHYAAGDAGLTGPLHMLLSSSWHYHP